MNTELGAGNRISFSGVLPTKGCQQKGETSCIASECHETPLSPQKGTTPHHKPLSSPPYSDHFASRKSAVCTVLAQKHATLQRRQQTAGFHRREFPHARMNLVRHVSAHWISRRRGIRKAGASRNPGAHCQGVLA